MTVKKKRFPSASMSGTGHARRTAARILGFASLSVAFLLTPISDSVAQTTKTYQVKIKTGTVDGAGTDADVYVTFYGPKKPEGVKSPTDLDSSGDDFENGDTRTYYVSITQDIGGLERIKLEHDNSGKHAGWYVDWVEILDPTEGKWVRFNINRWLSDDDADRLTYVTVDRADLATFKKKNQVQLAKPKGSWTPTCGGGQNCSAQLQRSMSVGGSETVTLTNEVRTSLSVAITAGYESVIGASASTTVTTGFDRASTEAKQVASTFSDGKTETCGQTIDMVKYNIHQVWQWTVSSALGDKPIVIKTCQIACMPDASYPNFGPSDPAAVGSCLKLRAAPQPAAVAAPQPAAAQPAAPQPSQPTFQQPTAGLDPNNPDVQYYRSQGWSDEEIMMVLQEQQQGGFDQQDGFQQTDGNQEFDPYANPTDDSGYGYSEQQDEEIYGQYGYDDQGNMLDRYGNPVYQ